jgi:hypothetical protein
LESICILLAAKHSSKEIASARRLFWPTVQNQLTL